MIGFSAHIIYFFSLLLKQVKLYMYILTWHSLTEVLHRLIVLLAYAGLERKSRYCDHGSQHWNMRLWHIIVCTSGCCYVVTCIWICKKYICVTLLWSWFLTKWLFLISCYKVLDSNSIMFGTISLKQNTELVHCNRSLIITVHICIMWRCHINNKKSQSNLGRATFPPLMAENNYATVPIGYNWMLNIYPQNCPFPFDDLHPNLIHPSLDRPHLIPQTASRSNQLFFHNSPAVPTGGIGNKSVPAPAYALLIVQRCS